MSWGTGLYKCSIRPDQDSSSKEETGHEGVNNIFKDPECQLVEVYTHDNKNVRRGLTPGGKQLWEEARGMQTADK